MKLNLKQVLTNLNGDELKNHSGAITLGLALSEIVIGHQAGGKFKMFIMGEKFVKDKEVDLDEADVRLVREAVEKTTAFVAPNGAAGMNTIVAGQILRILDEAESKAKAKKEDERPKKD